MFDLTGKSPLITGASGGIGGGIARALHAQGATVALTGRNADSLASLAGDLGERAHVIVADLADTASVNALIEEAGQKLDGINILVNNAGLTRDGLMLRMKDEDWDTVLDVNLTAGFKLARAVLRTMMKARWGRIINITSVVGQTGNPGQVNYVASKAGMTGFTKALAAEVASRNITVNCVAPGFITTAMTDLLTDEQKAQTLEKIPVSRFGNPEDVASAVVFLASDEVPRTGRQTLHVNGGMAMI
ncbi:MAG: 3-oxoacyl-[acyl-carrier-protein] reductase [Proteobacteria bacterium]|nr:3-oxoacyl-[acyl-carrier-protein] reductase [Pseudomonadota bacterium]